MCSQVHIEIENVGISIFGLSEFVLISRVLGACIANQKSAQSCLVLLQSPQSHGAKERVRMGFGHVLVAAWKENVNDASTSELL